MMDWQMIVLTTGIIILAIHAIRIVRIEDRIKRLEEWRTSLDSTSKKGVVTFTEAGKGDAITVSGWNDGARRLKQVELELEMLNRALESTGYKHQ